MRRPEQLLWDRMRRAIGREFYLERVENLVMPGRPDVDVMWRGMTLPVELKSRATMPSRTATPALGASHGLNPNQLNWWLRWTQCGGSGFIVVEIRDILFAIPSEFSEQINRMTMAEFRPHAATWAQFADTIRQEIQHIKRRS